MPSINLSEVTGRAAPKPPSFTPSPQQEAVFEYARSGKGSALIVAVAGAGKTTTLVETCKLLYGDVAFAAFNKKIADEIGRKLTDAGVGKNVKAATFHSFGFQAWRRAAPHVQVEAKKLDILSKYLGVPKNLQSFVRVLTSIAKQSGVGIVTKLDDYLFYDEIVEHYDLRDKLYQKDRPLSRNETDDLVSAGIEWAQRLVITSIDEDEKMIDFDDMIFSPLYHKVNFWQHDWMLVDEAQDTNVVRRLLAEAMLKQGGRLIAVGDPKQAIYGFTGASSDALDQIKEHFNTIELPLTVSYRCARSVVAHAQKLVSHIEAHPDAPEGSVSFISEDEFSKLVPGPTDAILCRNTKPLIQLALGYIKKGVAAHVEGRDIGSSLITLARRWTSVRTCEDLQKKLADWSKDEMIRLQERGDEQKIEAMLDRVESLYAIMESLAADDSIQTLVDKINSIFKDTEGRFVQSITLSTVHKAKGREWNKVWIYGRNVYMPSPFARQLWQIEQENNLIYVAITRAKRELVEVDLVGRK